MEKTLDLDLACGPAIPLPEKYVHTKNVDTNVPNSIIHHS